MSEFSFVDWATIIGLALTIIGLVATLVGVARARSTARQARDAARGAHARVMRFDVAAELVSAMSAIDEMKRLHRRGAWDILLERYGSLRKSLVAIKVAYPNLSGLRAKEIQGAIQHITNIEQRVEAALARKEELDIPQLNNRLSGLVDVLQEVLIEMKDAKEE